MALAPSGRQFTLEHQGFRATIAEVGATLREFSLNGAPVLWGFAADQICSGGRGQVLAPWPNRLADGHYTFHGVTASVPLSEPEKQNAIHGLVRWHNWDVVLEERAFVELACNLPPQPAYPFRIHLRVAYSLDEAGLTVRTRAEREDGGLAPFGIGFHPYFLAAQQGLAGSRLEFTARRHLLLDDRALPIGEEPLSGALADFGKPGGADLGPMVLDDCFAGLARDSDGLARVRFTPGDGPIGSVTLSLDGCFDYLMCFTGETLVPEDRRRAVALEPMSCPPNAFVTGTSLVELGAGAPFEARYSVLPTAS